MEDEVQAMINSPAYQAGQFVGAITFVLVAFYLANIVTRLIFRKFGCIEYKHVYAAVGTTYGILFILKASDLFFDKGGDFLPSLLAAFLYLTLPAVLVLLLDLHKFSRKGSL